MFVSQIWENGTLYCEKKIEDDVKIQMTHDFCLVWDLYYRLYKKKKNVNVSIAQTWLGWSSHSHTQSSHWSTRYLVCPPVSARARRFFLCCLLSAVHILTTNCSYNCEVLVYSHQRCLLSLNADVASAQKKLSPTLKPRDWFSVRRSWSPPSERVSFRHKTK